MAGRINSRFYLLVISHQSRADMEIVLKSVDYLSLVTVLVVGVQLAVTPI